MHEARRILVTGASGAIAGKLLQHLEADARVAFVAGMDRSDPTVTLGRAEFIRADLRGAEIAKVVASTQIDTIAHLGVLATPNRAGGRTRMKETNVVGTMHLLAAAQASARVRRIVMKSSTAAYGSTFSDPALFREDTDVGHSASGYAKDLIEAERYARSLARRRSDISVSILRMANQVGPTVRTPLTAYFHLPVLPTVLGYDPRIQLLHEDDAVGLVANMLRDPVPGTFNVAGSGILYLSQAIRMAGKPSVGVPRPFMEGLGGLVRRTGAVDFPSDQLRFLLYGRVGDISAMREQLGYEPAFSTQAALKTFLTGQGIRPVVDRQRLQELERRAADILGVEHTP